MNWTKEALMYPFYLCMVKSQISNFNINNPDAYFAYQVSVVLLKMQERGWQCSFDALLTKISEYKRYAFEVFDTGLLDDFDKYTEPFREVFRDFLEVCTWANIADMYQFAREYLGIQNGNN